eukprot:8669027-Pyramimonas_sp.AAC.2
MVSPKACDTRVWRGNPQGVEVSGTGAHSTKTNALTTPWGPFVNTSQFVLPEEFVVARYGAPIPGSRGSPGVGSR